MSSAIKDNTDLPKGWKIVKFSEVVNLKHGHQFRTHDFVSEGIPIIKIGQCKVDGTLDLSKCDYVSKNRISEFEEYKISKGDILMALTGGTLGKVTEVKEDYGLVFQNYRVGNFIPLKGISYGFTKLILLSDIFQNLVKDKVNQGAQPNIGKDNIDNMLIPLPPLPEQQRIVEKLDSLFERIDKAITLSSENLTHANNLLPAALNEVFENAEEKGWKEYKILDILSLEKKTIKPELEKEYNIIGLENIERDSGRLVDFIPLLGKQSISSKVRFEKGMILYGKLRPYLNKVWIAEFDGIATTEILPFKVKEKIANVFLTTYYLRSKMFLDKVNENCSGARMPRLTTKFWNDETIFLPEIKTQQKIVKHLNAISAQQQQLQQHYTKQLQQLKALKASLLNTAFSGAL